MKQTVPKKLNNLVKDSLRRHCWNIGVSHFVGDILYMEKDNPKDNDEEYTAMDITVNNVYMLATLRIYPIAIKRWKEEGDQFIERAIAHEVAHVIITPLQILAKSRETTFREIDDAVETITETLGRLSVKLDKIERKQA